ncbi:MAG: GNAT family N-acetyltransferase [candidate division Zixibacteria bacterium]|nr:GNAT family N-acetyltransferase [candidate division Zixibacteria bacterium]
MRLPILKGNTIHMRPLKRTDIPAIARGAHNKTISKFIPPIPYPYTVVEARKWVNCVHRSARADIAYQFGIERISKEGIVGMMGLNNLNWSDKNAEIECWLARPYWGKGFASEALKLLLRFAFGELKLHRVYAMMVSINEPSVRLLERHDFTREANWRKACRMNGGWHDVYAYGMLEEEAAKFK